MNLDGMIQSVNREEQTFSEIRIPTQSLRIEPGELVAGDNRLSLTDVGFSRVCRSVKAPPRYLRKLSSALQSDLLQHHVDAGDLEDHDGELVVFARNGEFSAFGNSGLVRLKGHEVLGAVADGTSHTDSLDVHDLRWTSSGFQADLLDRTIEEAVRPGDVVKAGLRISHSFLEEHATRIEAFLFRLVCRNGLVRRQCVAEGVTRTRRLSVEHPGARDLQKDQVRQLARETWTSLVEKLQTLASLRDERVNVEQLFRRWLERGRLSVRRLQPLLLNAWAAEDREPTAYAAVNAMTRVATHEPRLSPYQARSLSNLAGLFAFQRLHLCPRCFSLVRGFGEAA